MEMVLNSREVQEYLDQKCIRVQNSAPYSQWQNSVERNIQTAIKAVATLLHAQRFLPATFWDSGIAHFVDIRGHTPNKLLGGRSPMEVITNKPTNISNVYLFYFGEPILLTIVPPEHKHKFDVKNDLGLYLGQPSGQVDASIVWLPYHNREVNRSGAISLDISDAQYYEFYERQATMLHPLPTAEIMDNLLDFANMHSTNVYDREKHLSEFRPSDPILVNDSSISNSEGATNSEGDQDAVLLLSDSEGALIPTEEHQTLHDDTAVVNDESPIDRILSYTGDASHWNTLEFKVLYKDGDVLYHFYPAIFRTKAFEVFKQNYSELKNVKMLSRKQALQYSRTSKKKQSIPLSPRKSPYVQPPIPLSSTLPRRTTRVRFATSLDDLDDPYLYPHDSNSIKHKNMVAFLVKAIIHDEPTIKQALASEMRPDWITAIKAEVENLIATGTIIQAKYSDMKRGDQLIYFTMRLKVKRYADGQVDRLKARGCAMGNMVAKMPDFDKYSPTVAAIVAAAILALAAYFCLYSCTVDTVSAYLMQQYKESPALFIKFPHDAAIAAGLDPAIIYRIRKYLYGLPDAGRAYYLAYSKHLVEGGYTRSNLDPCLFFKYDGRDYIFISIHVDDTYLAASNKNLIEQFKDHLRTKFTITFKDSVHTYLGVQHIRDSDGSIQLKQSKLLQELFDKLNISSTTSVQIPVVENPTAISNADELCDQTEYKGIVGMLLFLEKSRPDMAYSVSDSATHASTATKADYQHLRGIGQFLYNTQHVGLTLPTGGDKYFRVITLSCWVDASYMIHSNQKSHTGYCFSLGSHGMFYSRSSVQQLIATSSTHAEMRALFTAVKDIIFLIQLFTELGFRVNLPINVYEDNHACVILANQHCGPSKNVKHFLVIVAYCREQVELGYIKVCDIDTEENIADILTKDIYNTKLFKQHQESLLGIINA
jgi:hypothetical protein